MHKFRSPGANCRLLYRGRAIGSITVDIWLCEGLVEGAKQLTARFLLVLNVLQKKAGGAAGASAAGAATKGGAAGAAPAAKGGKKGIVIVRVWEVIKMHSRGLFFEVIFVS